MNTNKKMNLVRAIAIVVAIVVIVGLFAALP